MKKIARGYISVIDFINAILSGATVIIFGLSLVVIFTSVCCRYFFKIPLGWSEELSKYLCLYLVFLAAAVIAREDRLIRIKFLQGISKKIWIKNIFEIIASIVAILFYIVAIHGGISLIEISAGQVSLSLGVPMSAIYFAIPLGCGLMVLETLALLIERLFFREKVLVEGKGNE